jgi:hypothetical protein
LPVIAHPPSPRTRPSLGEQPSKPGDLVILEHQQRPEPMLL